MFLDNEINAFVDRLESSEQLNNIRVIKAYPYVAKPTRLNGVIIAVSPSEIEGESTFLGEKSIFASCKINADIYVPFEQGSPEMWSCIRAVLSAQISSEPIAVAVSSVEVDNKLSCYTAKCSFTYNVVLDFAGQQD